MPTVSWQRYVSPGLLDSEEGQCSSVFLLCEYKTNSYVLWSVNAAHGQPSCFGRGSVHRGRFESVALAEA